MCCKLAVQGSASRRSRKEQISSGLQVHAARKQPDALIGTLPALSTTQGHLACTFPLRLPGCLNLVSTRSRGETWKCSCTQSAGKQQCTTAAGSTRSAIDTLSSSLAAWAEVFHVSFHGFVLRACVSRNSGGYPVINTGTEVSLQTRHTTANIRHVVRGLLGGSENFQPSVLLTALQRIHEPVWLKTEEEN